MKFGVAVHRLILSRVRSLAVRVLILVSNTGRDVYLRVHLSTLGQPKRVAPSGVLKSVIDVPAARRIERTVRSCCERVRQGAQRTEKPSL